MIQKTFCFSCVAIVGCALLFSGCENKAVAIKYFTIDELESLEKFKGYDIFEGPKIDGPYRVVSGVNNTIRREGMTRLHRELDFAGTRWVFKDENAEGYGYRFLALSNSKGEQCAIMLKSNNQVAPMSNDSNDQVIAPPAEEEKTEGDVPKEENNGE